MEQRQPLLAADPQFEQRVRASFARQQVMTTLGATLTLVLPGEVRIALPFNQALTQQHGFHHAGVTTTIVDSACGYAALSLMPPGVGVLTIEYKINFLAPGQGERFLAVGRVVKPGRTVMVSQGEVIATQGERESVVATMLATIMVVRDRPGVQD